jgi:hypothetical protein
MPRHLSEFLCNLKPKRALFTTYTFNVPFFDAALMPALSGRQEGCEIAVLADARQLAKGSLGSYSENAGIRYVLAPVIAPGGGVFHPKLAFIETDSEMFLCVGSANLTVAGQCQQLECWDVIRCSEAPGMLWQFTTFIDELAQALQSTSSRASAVLQKTARRLKQSHQPATLGVQEPKLIHTLFNSALDQLAQEFLTKYSKCDRITVLAPFHTRGGGPVKNLAAAVDAKLSRMAHDGVARFDADWYSGQNSTFVSPVVPGDARAAGSLHAKVYELRGQTECLVMTGSVNATHYSLETTRNVEVAVLRWAPASSTGFKWVKSEPEEFAPAEFDEAAEEYLLVEAVLRAGAIVEGIASLNARTSSSEGAAWTLYEAERQLARGLCELTESGRFSFKLPLKVRSPHASLSLEMHIGSFVARAWLNDEQSLYEAATGVRVDSRLAKAMAGVGDEESVAYIVSMLASALHTSETEEPTVRGERRTVNRSEPETGADEDAPFSYDEWVNSGHVRRRGGANLNRAQDLLRAVYSLLFPKLQREQDDAGSSEAATALAGTDEQEEDITDTRRKKGTGAASASTALPQSLEMQLLKALLDVQLAFERARPLQGAASLVRAVSAMELKKLQDRWRNRRSDPGVQWDYQKSILLWMERLCSYPFEDETRHALVPVVCALACLAARRVFTADADVSRFARLPVLRTLVERFARRQLPEDELVQLVNLGVADDLFTRLDPALVQEASECAQLLARERRLDESLFSHICACAESGPFNTQLLLSFPAVQTVLLGRRIRHNIVTVVDKRHIDGRACPKCGFHLSEDEVHQLQYTRAMQHPATRSASDSHLLVYPDDPIRFRALLEEVKQRG